MESIESFAKSLTLPLVIRCLIYFLGLLIIVISIVCLIDDDKDETKSNHRFVNFILSILMISTSAPLIFHFFAPRLLYILAFILASFLYLLCRLLIANSFKLHFQIPTILNLLLCSFYIYWMYPKRQIEKRDGSYNLSIIIGQFYSLESESKSENDNSSKKKHHKKKSKPKQTV